MKMKPADWTLSLRTVSSLNYLHNWLDSQMPSSLSCWPGGGAGLQVFRDSWIREQRSVDTGPAVWVKCIPGIRVMWQLELRVHRVKQWGEQPVDQRSVLHPGGVLMWCQLEEVWQMPAEHDAVTLIMGYFLACWANLIIIPPGHGIKRREKHPFISSFPIPGAETNTLGEMILQTKYFSLSLVQCPSSSLNWSHRTHFLWTRAEVYTNQSIRSNEMRPSLSWYWSLFSLLKISNVNMRPA